MNCGLVEMSWCEYCGSGEAVGGLLVEVMFGMKKMKLVWW